MEIVIKNNEMIMSFIPAKENLRFLRFNRESTNIRKRIIICVFGTRNAIKVYTCERIGREYKKMYILVEN